MSNKKYLIKKLFDYPEISNKEYLSLIEQKYNNNNDDLNYINERINLYKEKQMIINLIKNPYI